jgi:hypothetical protein
MTNLRNHTGFMNSYYDIIREERNLTAILYHLLLIDDNLRKFLDLIDADYLDKSHYEMEVYYEYAFLRDLWHDIDEKEKCRTQDEANDIKREYIIEFLDSKKGFGLESILGKSATSIHEFNEYFGATPKASSKFIQSPARWNIDRFNEDKKDMSLLEEVCKLKWAFNVKPDLVIHSSNENVLCIEAKLESPESSYSFGKSIVKCSQRDMQKYLMTDILGYNDPKMIFLSVNKKDHGNGEYMWSDVFNKLSYGSCPAFVKSWINRIENSST